VQSADINTRCPSCAACFAVADPSLVGESPRPWWDASVEAAEVACPVCGWEFVVDEEGRATDDGGLDPDGPFEVGPEGELVSETLLPATCPTCGRRFDVGEAGVAQCPGCRRQFPVDDPAPLPPPAPVGPEGWDEDELPYDEIACPACGSDGDLDSAGFLALDHGWVVCLDCGWEFCCEELFREVLAWQREERQSREEAGSHQLVVAADGSGDCPSLDRALGRVVDGGVILIRPGVYAGPAQLALRRLTLRGDGPAEEIRLTGGLEAIGSRLRLRGLTLTRAVQAHRSRLWLADCVLRGAERAGLEATGPRTRISLRNCHIERCQDFGVRANAGTVVRLSGCTVDGNAEGGAQVEGGAWVRFQGCRVAGNAGDGVRTGPQASVFLRRCVLADNGGAGIRLHGGRAAVTGCRFLNQTGTGVALGAGGRLLMRRCEVSQGQAHGLECGRRSRALIAECEVAANARGGVSVGSRARVVLTRSSVRGNGATGIRLAASGRLGVRGCACRDNRGGDWDIKPGGNLHVDP
jgi:hypothetical protein